MRRHTESSDYDPTQRKCWDFGRIKMSDIVVNMGDDSSEQEQDSDSDSDPPTPSQPAVQNSKYSSFRMLIKLKLFVFKLFVGVCQVTLLKF